MFVGNVLVSLILPHFKPIFNFYTQEKCKETFGVLTFSGDIEIEHCVGTGQFQKWKSNYSI